MQRVVLWVAFVARLGVGVVAGVSAVSANDPFSSRVFPFSDTVQYATLAQNMVEHGVFSLSTAPPYTPDIFRTPGYPALLALLYLLAGRQHSPLLILAVQLVLSMGNVWLVMVIGRRLSTPVVGYIAGLFYALAPATLIFGGMAATETLFATFLLTGTLALIELGGATGRRLWGYAALAGALFALATYTRPIGLLFIPLPVLAIGVKRGLNRRAVGTALVMLVVFAGCLVPWYLRNWLHFHDIVFTSLANQNLMIYNVASVEAQRQGISWRAAKDQLWAEYGARLEALGVADPDQAQMSRIMGDLAVEHILAHPAEAFIYQSADMVNAFRPGYSMAAYLLRDADRAALGQDIQAGDLLALAEAPLHEQVIYGLMTLYYAVFYPAIAVGAVVWLWRRRWFAWVVCALIPFWLLYMPGAAGNARFRAPVEGLLAVLAAAGIEGVWRRLAKRKRINAEKRGSENP